MKYAWFALAAVALILIVFSALFHQETRCDSPYLGPQSCHKHWTTR